VNGLIAAAAIAIAAIAARAAGAVTIVNGSFESPLVTPGTFNTYDSGASSTFLDGWTVTSGTIDHIGAGFWQASDGSQSLDLVGFTGIGAIEQSLTGLTIGASYSILFDMAGNPGGLRTLLASFGAVSQQFDFDATSTTTTNMGWVTYSLDFVAAATNGVLSFTSRDNSCCKGAALDNVRIVENVAPIPVPAAGLLLLGAVGGLMAARGRRAS